MSNSEQAWIAPPDNLTLPANEVHVWLAPLEQPEAIMLPLRQTLSPDELTRAGTFHFDKDRQHFIVARGVLRTLLSRYLDIRSAQLRFIYNDNGKPSLDAPLQGKTLYFNLSHSHNMALLAFSYVGEIGVDIEHMRAGIAVEQVASVSFSPREQDCLLALPVEERLQAFYSCWTLEALQPDAGALAVEGHRWLLRCYEWSGRA